MDDSSGMSAMGVICKTLALHPPDFHLTETHPPPPFYISLGVPPHISVQVRLLLRLYGLYGVIMILRACPAPPPNTAVIIKSPLVPGKI